MTVLQTLKPNVYKNIAIPVVAGAAYPLVRQTMLTIRPEDLNNFLLLDSIFLVTVCFANFAFTYEKVRLDQPFHKYLGHITTFVLMLLLALLLESIFLGVTFVYPSLFGLTLVFNLMLYLGVVLYDMWDYTRALDKI